MTNLPPPAEELRLLDAELRRLDARRAQLLTRRAWLLASLRPVAPPAAPRPETTAPRVQNVLLVLGGALLTIAAIAFTLVGWGHLGIAGRAAVLGAVTAGALAAPAVLLGRGLRSTAEAVAGLGLALTVLDAYALHEVAFGGSDGTGYAALASAVLAGLWAAYGLLPGVDGLRLPRPAALLAAQLPLLLWAVAVSAGPYGITAALLLTAGFDTGMALRATAGSVRLTAVLGAYGMGGWGVLAAGWLSWSAAGPSAAARAAALLTLAATTALTASWHRARTAPQTPVAEADGGRSPVLDTVNALLGGLLVVAACGGALRVMLPDDWTVPGYLLCGVALLAAVRAALPEAVRRGLVDASVCVQALALLWTLPVVAVTLLGPVSWAGRAWSGAPSDARAAVAVDVPWPVHAGAVPWVPVAVAVVLPAAVRDATWRPRAVNAALLLGWAAVLTLPAVLQLPYTAGLVTTMLATLAALVTARSYAPARITATVLALVSSLTLACQALASQTATLATLAALTAVFAGASWWSGLRPVTAPAAHAYAAALACATGAAAGWPPQHTALLVLVVPATAALLAARLPAPVALEAAACATVLLAVALAVPDPAPLALVLALCGVIAAATAARPDRRAAGYAATALFVLAAWVRLAAWGVAAPEAYTLPVTVPALLVGAWRRHRDPLASSWTAYGPGLAATLLPSLAAAWGDPHWTRPLLLGAAALLTTLLGARHRLQAPLALGGATLVLDALHELAPYLVQLTGALPRWAPPALAGLLLLALGATYEQRIRDARRVRDILTRLH
ncbi:SCO7613 C-terminal domain-containing membrane protein [Streptomyces sp. 7R007]